MTFSCVWRVTGCDCQEGAGAMDLVVKRLQWQVKVSNGAKVLVASDWVNLTKPQVKTFVKFKEITQQQMTDWMMTELGEKKMQEVVSGLQSDLEAGATIRNHPLPWETPSTTANLALQS